MNPHGARCCLTYEIVRWKTGKMYHAVGYLLGVHFETEQPRATPEDVLTLDLNPLISNLNKRGIKMVPLNARKKGKT